MTGPEHYQEGERLLAEAEQELRAGHMQPSARVALAAAHFAAAQAWYSSWPPMRVVTGLAQ